MCPPAAAEKIKNLLISVNDSGCSTGETLHAAYQELTNIIVSMKQTKGSNVDETDVVIADGHKSRFNLKVMDHCDDNRLDQFILPPDTSGVTQKHDQLNHELHSRYESQKSEMYTEYSNLNE